jgi:hypothetical protein
MFLSPKTRENREDVVVAAIPSSSIGSDKSADPTSINPGTEQPIKPTETSNDVPNRVEPQPKSAVDAKSKNGRRRSETSIIKEQAKEQRAKERAERAEKKAKEKAKKEREAQEKKMTPVQYAATVHEKWKDQLAKTPEERLCFKGCNIFFVGADWRISSVGTRNKMDRVSGAMKALIDRIVLFAVDCPERGKPHGRIRSRGDYTHPWYFGIWTPYSSCSGRNERKRDP